MSKNYLPGLLICLLITYTISGCNNTIQSTPGTVKDVTTSYNVLSTDSFIFYENALLKDSMNAGLHMAIATNYYAEKQFGKAIGHLKTVCIIDNLNKEAFITLGNVYYDTEQNDKAIEAYEKALFLDKSNVNVRCDLATCYLNLKNISKSFHLLKENIKIDPGHAQSHHNLSFVYSQMGKINEAEEEMKIYNALKK